MIGGGIPKDHGLFHGPVNIGFAGDGALCLVNGGGEVAGQAKVRGGDMLRQILLGQPGNTGQVVLLRDGAVLQGADELKGEGGIVPEKTDGLQYHIHALQGQDAAEIEHVERRTGFLLCRHRAVDFPVRLQIEHLCFFRITAQVPDKIIRMGFGVRDNPVSERQGFLIQFFQELCRQASGTELFPVLDQGVVKGNEEILNDRLFPQTAEKGQHQLGRKADEGQIIILHAGFQQGKVHL